MIFYQQLIKFFLGLCSGQRRRYSDGAAADKTGDQEDEYEDNIRNKILQASLPLVKDYGWSQQTIAEGRYICLCNFKIILT